MTTRAGFLTAILLAVLLSPISGAPAKEKKRFTSVEEATAYAEREGTPGEELIIAEPGKEEQIMKIDGPVNPVVGCQNELIKLVKNNLDVHRRNLKSLNNMVGYQNQWNADMYRMLRNNAGLLGAYVQSKAEPVPLVGGLTRAFSSWVAAPVVNALDNTIEGARSAIDGRVEQNRAMLKRVKSYTKPVSAKKAAAAAEAEADEE
ncbi:hypothetical protein M8J77_010523 [Diaphorina citri]|nr:hypothetical protein M8J77_010523 [Diaphorina citri]